MTRVSFDSTKKPLKELLKQAHAVMIQLPDSSRTAWRQAAIIAGPRARENIECRLDVMREEISSPV